MCRTRLDTKIHPRLVRGCKVRDQPGSHHRPSRSCRIRGNPKTQGRCRQRVRDSRKLGDQPTGAAEGEDSGQPGNLPSAMPEDAGCEETCSLIGGGAGGAETRGNPGIRKAGAAEGCDVRGNSKIHRRQNRKMQSLGRPKASSEAGREEWRRGATRGFARPASLKDARFGATRRSIAG